MPRQSRLVLPDVALHIVQRGHNRQACFAHDTDHLVYLKLLHDLSAKHGCALHAYCLMTNHVHLLLTPRDERASAAMMRSLGQQYVQYFNRRHGRSGTLWEGRFRSCLVDSAGYVLACYRYIELNPVRAGMATCAAAYRWSSHGANAGYAGEELLSPHREYLALSQDETSRRNAYRQLFGQGDEAVFLAKIREATNGGFPMVGETLGSQVAAMGRHLARKKSGPAPAQSSPDPLSTDLGLNDRVRAPSPN
jgi:putative transposase